MRQAAFILTHYNMGRDGPTAWWRLIGKGWNGTVAEFGEQVHGRLAIRKPGTERSLRKDKQKLIARSIRGTWLGIHVRTGEHIIATESGEAVRVRTIHRVPEDERWSLDAI